MQAAAVLRKAPILLPSSIYPRSLCAQQSLTCKSFAPSDAALSSRSRSHCIGAPLLEAPYLRTAVGRSRTRAYRLSTMAQQADIEVFGKAKTGSGSPSDQRGDCPFTQRVFLNLEEKSIPYKATYIEEGDNKPKWFMEKNPSGLMPVIRDGEKWLQDSDKIAEHLESKFPEPSLKTPSEFKSVGEDVFPTFTEWLQAKDPNSPAKETYIKALTALNDHLKSKGPFIAGEKVTESDLALAPKLLHARVALEHYYGFKIPEDLTAVKKYSQDIESRQSFKNSSYPDDMIIQGWQMKFDLPGQMITQRA